MKKLGSPIKFHWLKLFSIGLILFIFGLLIGLAVSFPSGILEKRLAREIEKQGQVAIDDGSISLGLLKVKGTGVVVRSQKNLWPPVEISSFDLTPLWLSLFSGNPGLHLDSRLLDGQLRADLYRNGSLQASADGLKLDFPLQNGWNMKVSGVLLAAQVEGTVPLDQTSPSRIDLTLNNVNVAENGKTTAMLKLGTITLKANGRGQNFRIDTLSATGGDFAVSGRGNLRVGSSPAKSMLSLRLEIDPQPGVDPALVELLKLAAHERSGGGYELRVSGNMARPTVN